MARKIGKAKRIIGWVILVLMMFAGIGGIVFLSRIVDEVLPGPEDAAAIARVEELIDALPDVGTVILQDREAIEYVQQAFNDLAVEQRMFVRNATTLNVVYSRLGVIATNVSNWGQMLEGLIDIIHDQIEGVEQYSGTEEQLASLITQLRNNVMTAGLLIEQIAMNTYGYIPEDNTRLGELIAGMENAVYVEGLIDALPCFRTVVLSDRDAVFYARDEFNKLTELQQLFVLNRHELVNCPGCDICAPGNTPYIHMTVYRAIYLINTYVEYLVGRTNYLASALEYARERRDEQVNGSPMWSYWVNRHMDYLFELLFTLDEINLFLDGPRNGPLPVS